MLLRNKVVRLFGLKDLGGLGGFDASKPASAYLPGERVGIFALISCTDNEVLLGDRDKHLNVVRNNSTQRNRERKLGYSRRTSWL